MATVQKILDLARSQIGVKESPANSNRQKYGEWYGMNGEPWCDMFISWLGDQVGQTDIGKFAYCPYHVNHFKSKGLWIGRVRPEPGDIVFFANGGVACHVGIVESVQSSTSFTSIEGNTSATSNDNGGAVMRRSRTFGTVGSTWYVLGFASPRYSAQVGWQIDSKGWWYANGDGTYPKSDWRMIGGHWYYFDKNGYALKGWHLLGGHWYYFLTKEEDGQPECSMRKGWFSDGKYWYYLRSAKGAKPEGSMMQSEQAVIAGRTHSFDEHGHMYNGIEPDGGLIVKGETPGV